MTPKWFLVSVEKYLIQYEVLFTILNFWSPRWYEMREYTSIYFPNFISSAVTEDNKFPERSKMWPKKGTFLKKMSRHERHPKEPK